MSRYGKAVLVLAFALTVAVGGLILTRQVIAVAGEADAERLSRAVLEYIAEKNPQAPIKAFQKFPEVLIAEAQRANIDHCLVLAQAEVESEFRHDAVGRAAPPGARDRGALASAVYVRLALVMKTKPPRPVASTRLLENSSIRPSPSA